MVRCVRGEVGGVDLCGHDGDVAGGCGDGVHAGVDGFGVDGSGQCDLGAARGNVVVGYFSGYPNGSGQVVQQLLPSIV